MRDNQSIDIIYCGGRSYYTVSVNFGSVFASRRQLHVNMLAAQFYLDFITPFPREKTDVNLEHRGC